MDTSRVRQAMIVVPPAPPRFSLCEWYLTNRERTRCCLDQQQLADRVLTENNRLAEKVEEDTRNIKDGSTHQLKERIEELEFWKKELEAQRKAACLEIESLLTYKERIFDALNSIAKGALDACKQCVILREGRLGIDLVHDDIEKELLKEVDIINGTQAMLKRTLQSANETIRKLRSAIYFLDRDLEDKCNAITIDTFSSSLDEHSLNLSIYHGTKPLDKTSVCLEEWETETEKKFFTTGMAINAGTHFRSYVDTLLRQIVEDLVAQNNIVKEAFRRRIEEIKEAKLKLENQHYEVTRQITEMSRNITNLEKLITEQENYMALCHTRLGHRCQRPGMECCKDPAQSSLIEELQAVIDHACILQHCLNEAQATMRYLLKTQIQLEEDLNIKTNSLKIDEVDCMSLLLRIDFHAY